MRLATLLRHPRSAAIGLSAALRAPGWLSGPRLKMALEAAVDHTEQPVDPDHSLEVALRVANGAVRHLARTGTAWKNTCLYRSMAQYLVLRDYGRSAAIRIGVQGAPTHTDDKEVTAHSWVVYHGPERVQDGGGMYEELRFRD
jgi:hypothetical protein